MADLCLNRPSCTRVSLVSYMDNMGTRRWIVSKRTDNPDRMEDSSSVFWGESLIGILVDALSIRRTASRMLVCPDPRCGVLMKMIPATWLTKYSYRSSCSLATQNACLRMKPPRLWLTSNIGRRLNCVWD